MLNIPAGKSLEAPIEFKAGTVIFAEGEISKYLFIVKKGQLRLLKSQGEHLLVQKVCEEKEILNEVSVLTNKPLEFSAIAKTDVELILIEQKDILAVMKNSPYWVPEIFQTLCRRLHSTLEIIEEHNLLVGEKKTDMFLKQDEEMKLLNALSEYQSH